MAAGLRLLVNTILFFLITKAIRKCCSSCFIEENHCSGIRGATNAKRILQSKSLFALIGFFRPKKKSCLCFWGQTAVLGKANLFYC